jgi:uncharacterized membrane protein YedE/YeeE
LGMYITIGILLVGLSIPLMQDKIRPNGLYGFRVAKTMNNPDIWYAVNRHFSYRLLWSGIACLASGIILYFVPGLSLDAYALGVLAIFAGVFLIGLLQSIHYMNSL